MHFPGCYQEEPQRLPSRWQQPCARRTAPPAPLPPHLSPTGVSAALFCRSQKGPSYDLAGPKHKFPWLKISICAISCAPGQPLRSTALHWLCLSSSPPKATHLHAQSQHNSGSTPNFCGFSFWESQPSRSALLKWPQESGQRALVLGQGTAGIKNANSTFTFPLCRALQTSLCTSELSHKLHGSLQERRG